VPQRPDFHTGVAEVEPTAGGVAAVEVVSTAAEVVEVSELAEARASHTLGKTENPRQCGFHSWNKKLA
jgi:hypothetical protein